MAETVTVTEAKTQLSQLIERAANGEEIVIRRGKAPVAKIVGLAEPQVRRKPGGLRGQIWMSDDFDELPAEIDAAFRGERP